MRWARSFLNLRCLTLFDSPLRCCRFLCVHTDCRGDFSSYSPVLETHGTTRLGRLSMLILFYSFTLGFVWMTMGLILDVWAGIIRGPNGMLAKGLSQVATTGSFNEGEMIGEGLGAAFSQSKIWAIFAFFGSFTLCWVLVPVPWNMYL